MGASGCFKPSPISSSPCGERGSRSGVGRGGMRNGNESLGRREEWAAGCEAPAPVRPRARALPALMMSCSLRAGPRLVTLLRAGRIPQRSVLWAEGGTTLASRGDPSLLPATSLTFPAPHPTLVSQRTLCLRPSNSPSRGPLLEIPVLFLFPSSICSLDIESAYLKAEDVASSFGRALAGLAFTKPWV